MVAIVVWGRYWLEFPSQKPFSAGKLPWLAQTTMELHRKQCDAVSLPFAHALKSAFDFHEAKIISALSFDVIGVIPHLSESGIMERNLRKLMIERNLVSSAKSCLVLHRIHEMGADGYVSFVMLLQRNRSSIVYQKLAEQLLMAAQEFYESWRNGLYSSRHFHRIESNLSSKYGVMFRSPDQTASVAVDMGLHGDVAAALPSGYDLTNTFEPLSHCTGCTLPPFYPHQQSLHDANEQCTSILDGKLHCDTRTTSVTCFTEESVCVLVKRFYESGGSQVERVGKLLEMITIFTCTRFVARNTQHISVPACDYVCTTFLSTFVTYIAGQPC